MSEIRIKRGFVDTPDGQIFYREAGSGPPIVLIHQILRTSLDYRFVMPILAKSHRVIAFDSVGCGDSDQPAKPYSLEDHGRAISRAMEALSIEGATIGGHHSGANVSMEVALQRPDILKNAVFSGLGYISDTTMLPETARQGFEAQRPGTPTGRLASADALERRPGDQLGEAALPRGSDRSNDRFLSRAGQDRPPAALSSTWPCLTTTPQKNCHQ